MAHHGQELGPQPLLLLQRRQVLEDRHEGLHLPIRSGDGRGVEQSPDAAAVGYPDDDLLGRHRFPRAQGLGQGQFLRGKLPAVRARAESNTSCNTV